MGNIFALEYCPLSPGLPWAGVLPLPTLASFVYICSVHFCHCFTFSPVLLSVQIQVIDSNYIYCFSCVTFISLKLSVRLAVAQTRAGVSERPALLLCCRGGVGSRERGAEGALRLWALGPAPSSAPPSAWPRPLPRPCPSLAPPRPQPGPAPPLRAALILVSLTSVLSFPFLSLPCCSTGPWLPCPCSLSLVAGGLGHGSQWRPAGLAFRCWRGPRASLSRLPPPCLPHGLAQQPPQKSAAKLRLCRVPPLQATAETACVPQVYVADDP